MMGVEVELFVDVVIGGHGLFTDNSQLLLLHGFIPRNVEVGVQVAWEVEVSMDSVGDAVLEMGLGC